MRAETIEEHKENLRALLIARAATLDKTSQEEVNQYNEMQKQLIDLASPERKSESKDVEEGMKGVFNKLFRDAEGRPKPISAKVGDAYDENTEFDNYLKRVPKDKK